MMYSQARRVSCARGVIDSAFGATPNRLMTAHPVIDGDATARRPARVANERSLETVVLLEAAASAFGAADLGADGILAARTAGDELRSSHDAPGTAIRWARAFHQTLLDACPNRHMLDLIEHESRSDLPLPLPDTVDADELDRIADDHDAILALVVIDAPRREIERALREHASRSTLCCLVPVDS